MTLFHLDNALAALRRLILVLGEWKITGCSRPGLGSAAAVGARGVRADTASGAPLRADSCERSASHGAGDTSVKAAPACATAEAPANAETRCFIRSFILRVSPIILFMKRCFLYNVSHN